MFGLPCTVIGCACLSGVCQICESEYSVDFMRLHVRLTSSFEFDADQEVRSCGLESASRLQCSRSIGVIFGQANQTAECLPKEPPHSTLSPAFYGRMSQGPRRAFVAWQFHSHILYVKGAVTHKVPRSNFPHITFSRVICA